MKKSILGIVAFAALGVGVGQASAQSLGAPGCPGYNMKPLNSNQSAGVTFLNQSPKVQQIYWIDMRGDLKHYRTLRPGQRYHQPTYVGPAWMVWEENRCNYWFTVGLNQTTVTLR